MDDDYQITDITKLKKELMNNLGFYSYKGEEIAVYTRDYQLIFSTDSSYWLCDYFDNEGKINLAYLNISDWFTEEEVEELIKYRNSDFKVTKISDLCGYYIQLNGFWLKDGMVIPKKISVQPVYAKKIDKKMNVIYTYSDPTKNVDYTADYKNTEGLQYYQSGTIYSIHFLYYNAYYEQFKINGYQSEMNKTIKEKDKIEKAVSQIELLPLERVNLVTYRYYDYVKYHSSLTSIGTDEHYGDYITVVGVQENLLKQCISTLIYVWSGCFLIFSAAAFILATQTYKIYKKRAELDRYRSETTNALAHDLKTPLSIISGYAQNLIENIHTEKREYYAGNINANVNRMDKTIREMLELSRYDSDIIQPKKDDVSLSVVCSKLMDSYSHLCEEKHITTELEGDAVVKADFTLLERAIDNFFINALDYTPEGGSIHIKITDNSLEFYNSGSHIPEEIIGEIWQPYKTADPSRSSNRGSGLGLSIAAKILDMYKFSYGAKNEDDGVVFYIQW
jgi:signal transduction histidine kinase